MKRKHYLLAVLALVLVLSASIGTAVAYFTTYSAAQGGYVIRLGAREELTELFSSWTKHVTITSKEDSIPAYVRVKAFSGSEYPLSYSGDGWTEGSDGWWYYVDILKAGETTGNLDILISEVPTDVTDGDSFNVVVVYEYATVKYDADGNALPYDSDTIWRAVNEEGGEG